MAFRWFRQNKQLTRWIYIGVTVFVMVTFTVTGAMIRGLKDESDEIVAGSFTLPGGKEVVVKAVDFQRLRTRLARLYPQMREEQEVWRFLMLDALAREAGIVVGDDLFAAATRAFLERAGVRSEEELKRVLGRLGLSPLEFEDLMRDDLRVRIYEQIASDPPRVLSERVFERFQQDHEKFLVDYVSFADAEARDALETQQPDEAALRRFYDEEMSEVLKANEFSTPERYLLDLAYLDPTSRSREELEALLPQERRAVSEAEIRSFYERFKELWRVDAAKAGGSEEAGSSGSDAGGAEGGSQEASEAGAAGEGGSEEEAAAESEGEEAAYRPLEEVTDEIVRRILAARVVEQAARELQARFAERREEEDADAQESEGESGEEEAAQEDEAGSRPDPLDEVAEKYGLEIRHLDRPLTRDEIERLPEFGSPQLAAAVLFLQVDGVRPVAPTPERPIAFLVRLRDKEEAEPLPFEEVSDRLLEPYFDHKARERAEQEAEAFLEALREKARRAVADEVAAVEAEAAAAEKRIAEEGVEEEAAREAIRSEERAKVEGRITALIEPHLGESFEEVAADRSLEVRRVDWFRKSYRTTTFWQDDPPGPEKFLKGHAPLFDVEKGGVLGPVRDDEDRLFLVARVTDRAFPDVSEMRLKDRLDAVNRVRSEIDPQWFVRRFAALQGTGVQDPQFSYETLSQRLGLRIKKPDEKGTPEN